jgi:ribose-phosphate pyrophosphokinase
LTEGPIIVATESDNPFAIDIGRFCQQRQDISDLISLKSFANAEFCPRFIVGGDHRPGFGMVGRRVVIVSTSSATHSRNSLAMRTFLVARAARDNGAESVMLVEPDLFYSAQDRGPRPEHGRLSQPRPPHDYDKFEGQPFSSRLYAELLRQSGIDTVLTVHNHSVSVMREFEDRMPGGFHNLIPAHLFARYITDEKAMNVADEGRNLVICAPDRGALDFALEVRREFALPHLKLLQMRKERSGERQVQLGIDHQSELALADVAGKDVLVVDDMVRTGSTIMECCHLLRQGQARRVVFAVTHFYSSEESRSSLNSSALDEIITTNTIPTILNRDTQGRLRKKLCVLKIERWIARFILLREHVAIEDENEPPFTVDMSSKHPRWSGGS